MTAGKAKAYQHQIILTVNGWGDTMPESRKRAEELVNAAIDSYMMDEESPYDRIEVVRTHPVASRSFRKPVLDRANDHPWWQSGD